MRDPRKLHEFYQQLEQVHLKYFRDQRPGQFFSNWLGWIMNVKNCDIFYPESDRLLELLNEYVASQYPYNHGQNLFSEETNVSD